MIATARKSKLLKFVFDFCFHVSCSKFSESVLALYISFQDDFHYLSECLSLLPPCYFSLNLSPQSSVLCNLCFSLCVSSLCEAPDPPLVSSGKSQTTLLSRGLKDYTTTGAGDVECVYLSVLPCTEL